LAGVGGGLNRIIGYGQLFQLHLEGDDFANLRVALVRVSAVTHGNNMDQRYVWLEAQPMSGTQPVGTAAFWVRAPDHGSIAPPGDYMLFAVDRFGIPSVATFVQLTQTH
jgi:hypothetical protein